MGEEGNKGVRGRLRCSREVIDGHQLATCNVIPQSVIHHTVRYSENEDVNRDKRNEVGVRNTLHGMGVTEARSDERRFPLRLQTRAKSVSRALGSSR